MELLVRYRAAGSREATPGAFSAVPNLVEMKR